MSSLVSDFTFLKSLLKDDKISLSNLTQTNTSLLEDTKNDDTAFVNKQHPAMRLLKYSAVKDVPTFTIACARMASIFPHSMYVERLVSSHNLIKSEMRSSLDLGSINDYLIVKESMGSVAKFDPRPAIAKWLLAKDRRPKTADTNLKIEKYKTQEYVKKFFH